MFGIDNDDKTLVLIDGANMYATTKALGFSVDFQSLYEELKANCNLLRIYYYTALAEEDDRIIIKPLVDWLTYNNYTVVTKAAKIIIKDGVKKIKGNMDIELAVDALLLAPKVGNIIIFTGDGDFCCLVRTLQQYGVRVTVVSSAATHPPMCADDLRKQADKFIELASIKDYIIKQYQTPDVEEVKEIIDEAP